MLLSLFLMPHCSSYLQLGGCVSCDWSCKGPIQETYTQKAYYRMFSKEGELGNSFKEKSAYFCLNPPLWGILVLYLVLNPSFCM